ncbi:hypothetical protein, partial [Pseudomonas aeruginosa]|uniref:hypothetical protein n=3 Tax=Pseudomonas aeruginosa TaxID=287 RepID=UPI001C2D6A0B
GGMDSRSTLQGQRHEGTGSKHLTLLLFDLWHVKLSEDLRLRHVAVVIDQILGDLSWRHLVTNLITDFDGNPGELRVTLGANMDITPTAIFGRASFAWCHSTSYW